MELHGEWLSTGQDVAVNLFLATSFIVPGAALILLLIALVIPTFFLLMWVVGGYNRLVALRNGYRGAFTQLDAQLKRRYDLIPELVETAKGYIQSDRGTLAAVGAARDAAWTANVRATQAPGDISAMRELSGAESALAGTLGRFFSTAAACPELKANSTMMSLTEELTSTATKAASAGQSYNDAVMRYNTLRDTFPTNLIARPFSFGQAELFAVNGLVPHPV